MSKEWKWILYSNFLFFSIMLLFCSGCLFFIGFHNVDIGYNMRGLNGEYGLNMSDTGLDGIVRSEGEIYILGVRYMAAAYLLGIVSMMLLVAGFEDIIHFLKGGNMEEETKKQLVNILTGCTSDNLRDNFKAFGVAISRIDRILNEPLFNADEKELWRSFRINLAATRELYQEELKRRHLL